MAGEANLSQHPDPRRRAPHVRGGHLHRDRSRAERVAHDSPWILGPDERTVFLGDQIYDHRHCYLADGFHEQWLSNIEALRARFLSDAVFHVGHGGPVGAADWDWQRGYIELFLDAVGRADWSHPERAHAAVVAEMKRFLPTDELQFLMELSIQPVAEQLGLATPAV